MGKTAFAMNIAENASIEDQKVVGMFFEMSREALLLRLLCSKARVDSHKMRTGSLWRDDMDKVVHAMDQLAHAPIFIDDTPVSLAKGGPRRGARPLPGQARSDYRVLPAAHVRRRQALRKPDPGSVRYLARAVGQELKVPVVARPGHRAHGKPGRRSPSPTRGSARIRVDEQDADVVAFIFREEVYKPDEPELDGVAEIIIAKQRNGALPAGVKLAFVKRSTRFESMAQDGMGSPRIGASQAKSGYNSASTTCGKLVEARACSHLGTAGWT